MQETTNMHPKAVEAAAKAAQMRSKKLHHKTAVKKLVEAKHYRFVYNGDNVVCYHREHDVIKFATATKNPSDKSDMVFGKFLAATRLENNQAVTVRKPSYVTPYEYMSNLARNMW